jgi:hypothetical protein
VSEVGLVARTRLKEFATLIITTLESKAFQPFTADWRKCSLNVNPKVFNSVTKLRRPLLSDTSSSNR